MPLAMEFMNNVLKATLLCMQVDDEYKAATSKAEVQKPLALTNLAKWTKFWELFTTYLSHVKGAVNMPLSYLVHKHDEVTTEVAAAEYGNSVDRLVATTVLQGAHFNLDNCTLYDALKPLVDGPGWAFVRRFDKQKDGRGAVLALNDDDVTEYLRSLVDYRTNPAYRTTPAPRRIQRRSTGMKEINQVPRSIRKPFRPWQGRRPSAAGSR
jgi:RNA binding exosome subunit